MTIQTMPTTSKPLPQALSTLERWFPIATWLPKYDWDKYLTPDLIAVVSVAALLIPESMGYSAVTGVPVQIGLYAARLILIAYGLAVLAGARVPPTLKPNPYPALSSAVSARRSSFLMPTSSRTQVRHSLIIKTVNGREVKMKIR